MQAIATKAISIINILLGTELKRVNNEIVKIDKIIISLINS